METVVAKSVTEGIVHGEQPMLSVTAWINLKAWMNLQLVNIPDGDHPRLGMRACGDGSPRAPPTSASPDHSQKNTLLYT